jgi:hypothetical protein
MNDANRDLLVLSRAEELSPEEMERELTQLNAILYHAERWESFCTANEIIDINRHKIIIAPNRIQKILKREKQKAFVFVNGKN